MSGPTKSELKDRLDRLVLAHGVCKADLKDSRAMVDALRVSHPVPKAQPPVERVVTKERVIHKARIEDAAEIASLKAEVSRLRRELGWADEK